MAGDNQEVDVTRSGRNWAAGRPAVWLLLPAALSLAAILPLPYGFYTFLRLVVTVSALAAAYMNYRVRGVTWEVVCLGLVALLFNPLIPVGLSRGVWLPINLAVGALFAFLALRRSKA